jgi:hypothetical protein
LCFSWLKNKFHSPTIMPTQNKETTPDQLLEAFRGRSIKSIVIFTLIVHIVIIGGASVPYFIKKIAGDAASELSEQERTDLAIREATSTIRDIAAKHGIKPQDLSSSLAGKAPKAPKAETPTSEEEPPAPPTETPEDPKSAIEQELEVQKVGPEVPSIPVEEASDDDLFK